MQLHAFYGDHYEFSAVLKNASTDKLAYVSIYDVRVFNNWHDSNNNWYDRVLPRTMSHDKDWTGGAKQHCTWPNIAIEAAKITQ